MRVFLPFLLIPALALAQTTTTAGGTSSNNSANVEVLTSLSTSISLDANRQEHTIVSTFLVTITSSASPASNTSSSNSTSGNATSSSSTSTSFSPLPTAPSTVAGGGGIGGSAPVPGATGVGGIYGPPDGYISSAERLRKMSLFVSLAGLVAGGLVTLM